MLNKQMGDSNMRFEGIMLKNRAISSKNFLNDLLRLNLKESIQTTREKQV